jgi:hypothetical protein
MQLRANEKLSDALYDIAQFVEMLEQSAVVLEEKTIEQAERITALEDQLVEALAKLEALNA